MKSNRMFGILCKLLENEKITAKELADYFEVSVRTIHRDLLDLSSAGFPVVTQQGIGGGVSPTTLGVSKIASGGRNLFPINDSLC